MKFLRSVAGVIALLIALAVGKLVGHEAVSQFISRSPNQPVDRGEFNRRMSEEFDKSELYSFLRANFPTEFTAYVGQVYSIYMADGNPDRFRELGFKLTSNLRKTYGAYATQAESSYLVAIFNKKSNTIDILNNKNPILCKQYLMGQFEQVDKHLVESLDMEQEALLLFRAVKNGMAVKQPHTPLTDTEWNAIVAHTKSDPFTDREIALFTDPKLNYSEDAKVVCGAWQKLYFAVGQSGNDIEAKFIAATLTETVAN